MAENAAPPAAAPQPTVEKTKKRKCAQTGVPLKRVRRYYRDGEYFVNKNAYQLWKKNKIASKPQAKDETASQSEKAPAPEGATEKQA